MLDRDTNEVVIIDAVRTPIGRRGGSLSGAHTADLLAQVLRALVDRTQIDPAHVGQVVGGCVSQVGMQTMNLARTGWLAAGLPMEVAETTVDSQCGSSQQATSLATGLVGSGIVDVAIACGAEVMSRVQMGASMPSEPDSGFPIPDSYSARYEMTSQFEGAERIADKWGITRRDCDEYGKRSQDLCAAAWGEDRFATQIVPTDAPVTDDHGTPSGERLRLERDEGLRETSLDKLAQLKPVGRPDGVHTAGSSSQVSDGAGAVMVTTQRRATELGLTPKVRVLDTCLVGSDPVLMLTGPIDATRTLLERNGMTMADIDVVEINEAFASVVLAWARELSPDMAIVNPNGGAIAHGHPLGGTGAILMAKAVHELERSDKSVALVTMCCGGGLGTGTLLERVG